ncbi:MAG: phosphopantetheine-binding protein [Humidesulfovibrio sp.]|uniref:acyl carrier protein n=1 Tax=Humidesulfovibrio sp. TaxID=2910988 RepID=UPI0027E763D8|nr:phosphopantetheine-binding protein [Humidesulfovibrio sp.]MDQ7834828.1 phosphopantetheine-binding protein [Humidesulfovibrio sp.]
MTRSEVSEKLFAILCESCRKAKDYPQEQLETAVLTKDLGMDSLDLISALFRIEEEFGVNIPEEDLKGHASVFGPLATYITGKLG